MARSLFLLIIAGLIGVVMNPGTLTATDIVATTGLDETRIVETVPLPEPEPEPEFESEPVILVAPAAPINYTVTIRTNTIQVNNLSYGDIYGFRKLVYGHNSGNLLGNLIYRYAGEIINITENGTTMSYRVAEVAIYEKHADGTLEGDAGLMARIANGALGHSVALMTCAGTPLGNGDATHRLVVFADAV